MKCCFVIQGYGRKTDYRDGRVLDLDASYAIIKDAVEAAGLECIRADEIQHSGTIDLPMYQWLLNADLVVADLSNYNVNAVFELGVRYALRPHATIIVAEERFQNPFDFSHIAIRRYKHLGDDIGAKEARRFRDELRAAIEAIAAEQRTDSPIYTFLPTLRPPVDQKSLDEEALAPFAPVPSEAAAEPLPPMSTMLTHDGGADTEAVDLNTKQLLEQAQMRINDSDFASARVLLEEAHKRRPTGRQFRLPAPGLVDPQEQAARRGRGAEGRARCAARAQARKLQQPRDAGPVRRHPQAAAGDQPCTRAAGHRHHRLCSARLWAICDHSNGTDQETLEAKSPCHTWLDLLRLHFLSVFHAPTLSRGPAGRL